MAKAFSSVIGIDLGKRAFKAVLLHRNSKRITLSNFASHIVEDGTVSNPELLSKHLKILLKELGGRAKGSGVAVSDEKAILRVIEQPATPPVFLREALRLQGLQLLNQDCRNFVLDCDLAQSAARLEAKTQQATSSNGKQASTNSFAGFEGNDRNDKRRYLVGGLPRDQIASLLEVLKKVRLSPMVLQLAPIANFNAFEFNMDPSERNNPFLLVDIGYEETRVIAGYGAELALIRSIDFGGRQFLDAVSNEGAIDHTTAITLIEQGDLGMADVGRESLAALAQELRSSIGFFEGQYDRPIQRAYFSGSLVNAELPLQILSDELEIPCGTWDAFSKCEISVPRNKLLPFNAERLHLNVACGVALEMLFSR